ncbi:hypothetical protein CVT24_007036 [Panaeolus cyanescens]|uniref:T6SS Phospholipase effector Tle1-like catalytic domain-containing protein n=1 Tax=Panaeolus cyanescens TaxID=181874 RepID=A0A409W9Y9_9AGAR|nr:hypothetical protein CVT24_007036 [Panaeolus cyanescens]
MSSLEPLTATPSAMQAHYKDTTGLSARREATLNSRAVPAVIPPEHDHRTLVLCFDGTGDQFDSDNSNIAQLVSLLKKDDRTRQLVYHQTGIGTCTSVKYATPFMSKIRKTLDESFAWNLSSHVMNITGDRICIFGFSRGAYTARSLAGMLCKVGLLPAGNFEKVPFAYKMYTRIDHTGWKMSNEFKKAFCVDVGIEFLGVWDTVDSVGIIPKRLPFTTSNTVVRTFRHALALDERRAKFYPSLWHRLSTEEEVRMGLGAIIPAGGDIAQGDMSHDGDGQDGNATGRGASGRVALNREQRKMVTRDNDKIPEIMFSENGDPYTDVEEVWFAGCHCDVGGGAVSNKTRHSLARITLRWMVRECFKTNTGIMFNSEALLGIGMDPSTLYPFVVPRPPPIPVKPAEDAPSSMNRGDGVPAKDKEKAEEGERVFRIQNPPKKRITIRPHYYLSKLNPKFKIGNKGGVPSPSPSTPALAVAGSSDEKHEDGDGEKEGGKKRRKKEEPSAAELLREHADHSPSAHKPTPFLGSEEEEEVRDAMSPKYDQLKLAKGWWIYEILPLRLRYQREDDVWVSRFKANMASPRFIPTQISNGFKVHRSVKMRMEAEYEDTKRRRKGKMYLPKPRCLADSVLIWID